MRVRSFTRLLCTTSALGVVALCVPGGAVAAETGPAAPAGEPRPAIGRQVLSPGDGWGSASTGTTGGSAATADQVHVVRTRDELATAVAGDTPKIVYVEGTIDANTDTANTPLSCDEYATDGYGLNAFLEAYDPATWGRVEPSGPLEEARQASAARQRERIRIEVGSNTTIVGLAGAGVKGAGLVLDGVDNVIVRGIDFQNAHDCFPAWDPTDGDLGEWNSEYDAISLTGATHVWVDHNTLSDGDMPDSEQPTFFGRRFQVHDGLLDITDGSDLVTASWNRFTGHDKVMLIGSSDSASGDTGKLRVTVHHNEFAAMGQRTPRVRFGQVDVYDNHYAETSSAAYVYSWGVGVRSAVVAERNAFTIPGDLDPAGIVQAFNGTALHTAGNAVNGAPVDLLAAYNAAVDPDLSPDVGWTPALRTTVHPAQDVPHVVTAQAGADHLHP